MFRRIRDFIYDINDIFIALMIILVAVGIIVWRSTMIMSYPEYLANKPDNSITFDDPKTAGNVSVVIPGGSQNEADNAGGNSGENDDQTKGGSEGGEDQQPSGGGQNGQGTEDGTTEQVVRAKITIEFGFRGNWYTVADRIIETGVLKQEDRDAFFNTANENSKYRTGLKVGTFEISSDMTYEQMIRVLCNLD